MQSPESPSENGQAKAAPEFDLGELDKFDAACEQAVLELSASKERVAASVERSYERMKDLLLCFLDSVFEGVSRVFEQNSQFAHFEALVEQFQDAKSDYEMDPSAPAFAALRQALRRLLCLNHSPSFRALLDEQSFGEVLRACEAKVQSPFGKDTRLFDAEVHARDWAMHAAPAQFLASLDFVPLALEVPFEHSRKDFYRAFRPLERFRGLLSFRSPDEAVRESRRKKDLEDALSALHLGSARFDASFSLERLWKVYSGRDLALLTGWPLAKPGQLQLVFLKLLANPRSGVSDALLRFDLDSPVRKTLSSADEAFVAVETAAQVLKCFRAPRGGGVEYWLSISNVEGCAFCAPRGEPALAVLKANHSLTLCRMADQEILFRSESRFARKVCALDATNLFVLTEDFRLSVFNCATLAIVSEVDFLGPRTESVQGKYFPKVSFVDSDGCSEFDRRWREWFLSTKRSRGHFSQPSGEELQEMMRVMREFESARVENRLDEILRKNRFEVRAQLVPGEGLALLQFEVFQRGNAEGTRKLLLYYVNAEGRSGAGLALSHLPQQKYFASDFDLFECKAELFFFRRLPLPSALTSQVKAAEVEELARTFQGNTHVLRKLCHTRNEDGSVEVGTALISEHRFDCRAYAMHLLGGAKKRLLMSDPDFLLQRKPRRPPVKQFPFDGRFGFLDGGGARKLVFLNQRWRVLDIEFSS